MDESIRMTEDRDKCRKYVHGVANPRIEDAAKIRSDQTHNGGDAACSASLLWPLVQLVTMLY